MLALAFAVATAVAAPAPNPPDAPDAPDAVDAYCTPDSLARYAQMPKDEYNTRLTEVDQHIALTLAAERKAEADVAMQQANVERTGAAAERVWMALVGLGVAGLVLALAGARRRSPALAVLASCALPVVAWLAFQAHGDRAAAQATLARLTARQLQLTQCRFRVTDVRIMLMHGRLARCIHDLDEHGEDIGMLLMRLTNEKKPVEEASLKKLMMEIRQEAR